MTQRKFDTETMASYVLKISRMIQSYVTGISFYLFYKIAL